MFRGRSQPTYTNATAPVAEASEEALLAAAMEYDDAALSELYDRYEVKIFTYIYRRTGDESLAEDLTSQVFLKMLESIRDQKAWRSSFSGWLYKIAHNLVIDHYRRRGRQSAVELRRHNPLAAERQSLESQVEQSLECGAVAGCDSTADRRTGGGGQFAFFGRVQHQRSGCDDEPQRGSDRGAPVSSGCDFADADVRLSVRGLAGVASERASVCKINLLLRFQGT
jgi:RNA polymerase sigma factor (sigma-70 family)